MFLLLILFALVIPGLATLYVKNQTSKYSKVPVSSGLSGAETAKRILQSRGIYDVSVVPANGMMGDHYDPTQKVIALTPDIYDGRSTAAVGVAAHECGHAIQHQMAYFPLQLRSQAVGLTRFSSSLLYIPFLLMMMRMITPHNGYMVMAVGAMILMAFNLVTLPVEFDASARAKVLLPELGIIRGTEEARGVNRVLNAAAMTYVAAFLASMASVVYYLMLAGDRRR